MGTWDHLGFCLFIFQMNIRDVVVGVCGGGGWGGVCFRLL